MVPLDDLPPAIRQSDRHPGKHLCHILCGQVLLCFQLIDALIETLTHHRLDGRDLFFLFGSIFAEAKMQRENILAHSGLSIAKIDMLLSGSSWALYV